MDSSTKRIIFLGAFAFVLTIVVLVIVIRQLLGNDDQTTGEITSEQFATFPTGEQLEVVPVRDDGSGNSMNQSEIKSVSDSESIIDGGDEDVPSGYSWSSNWQDEIVSHRASGGSATATYAPSTRTDNSNTKTITLSDLIAQGRLPSDLAGLDPNTPIANDPAFIDAFVESYNNGMSQIESSYDQAQNSIYLNMTGDIADCGSFELQGDEDARDLDSVPAIACMGEALANSCEASRMDVSLDSGQTVTMYLYENLPGSCGVGVAFEGGKTIQLCSAERLLNEFTGLQLSFAQWSSVINDKPSDMFSALYFRLTYGNSSINSQDCYYYNIP